MNKAIVLFSGGLDSTTCLALAVEKYGNKNVIALSMSYGQKHEKELQCAERLVSYYGVKLVKYDLSKIFEQSNCSLLKMSGSDVPAESYAEQISKTDGKPVTTYVPYRNGLFLSVAASLALIYECEVIYYGAHRDDAAGDAYPDCSEEFNTLIGGAIYEGSGHQVRVEAPFINKTKADIVATGLRLNVPYEMTWSCYNGGDVPCGKCGTCIDRINAFKANGKEDPIYESLRKHAVN